MSRHEIRDSEEADRFVLQGLWWQRALPPQPGSVHPSLQWALEIASSGRELPPLGFLADLAHIAFGDDRNAFASRGAPPPHLPILLLRTYEDHVLGKFYADWTFSRAADALRRYQGRDRARGLAFVVGRFAERSGFEGVLLNPGVLKSALQKRPEDLHAQGWESLESDGLHPVLLSQYEMLIAAARRCGEVLGPEDVSQLERGTALKPEGEQLAERQVLRAAHLLEARLPRHRLRPRARLHEVPTRILDEDTYPVGGYTSLATRGSIESLLHSQLAYMESGERPDLFDIKYLRDELLYSARDENQFLRRRRTFAFFLYPDLQRTRCKDRGLNYQRGVLLLALLYDLVRKLSEWLTTEALSFQFVFVVDGDNDPLQPERDLLASLLRDEIANGTAMLTKQSANALPGLCAAWALRSQCHALLIDVRNRALRADDVQIHQLVLDGPRPALADAGNEPKVMEADEPLDSWNAALQEILECWSIG
jgi:hypothetical protein